MSDAFAAAAAALFDDPNLGRAATYTPAGGGASVSVRVHLSRAQSDPFSGDMGGRAASTVARLAVAALTAAGLDRPGKGATLILDGDVTTWRVAQVEADPAGAIYTLTLAR